MWLRDKFDCFWRECQNHCIIYILIIVGGIVFGAVSGYSITSVLQYEELRVYGLRWYDGQIMSMGLFGSIFDVVILFGVILAVNINIYFMPLNYVLALYRGYLAGYNSLVIISFLGISGIAGIVFVFIPQQVIQLVFFCAFSSRANIRCIDNRNAGFLAFSGVEYRPLLKRLFFILAAACVVQILFYLVFGIASSGAVI